ncbi:hypothetical protein LCGC14_0553770 [marine sediment metagenome]|uniref:Uncharacterized protein n=1 Tax=marine sediment metagenome TaxID=412755 RepID=A0A0F9S7T7_9ZZZZ
MENNTNIYHVNMIQGLLHQVSGHIKKIEPEQNIASKSSKQAIVKENAIEGLKLFQEVDIAKMQEVFE